MDIVNPDAYLTKPASGKALIFFVRSTTLGWMIQAALYDDMQFIGTVSAKTHLAYQADPGKHLFMVTGESADFLEADLTAGKTYYADVVPRLGAQKARFSLRPHNGQVGEAVEAQSLAETRQVTMNANGIAWGEKNKSNALKLKDKYLPVWQAKPDDVKQRLRSESGR